MSALAIAVIVVAFLGLVWVIARDVCRVLAKANLLYERQQAGECHCTRHRLCSVCLEYLRSSTKRKEAA